MKRLKLLILSTLLITLFTSHAKSQSNAELTIKELNEHVTFLASDELKGRLSGTPEGLKAATYIRDQFKKFSTLMGEEGFQFFEIVTDVKLGANNSFSFENFNGIINENFAPYAFSSNSIIEAQVVFAGYGLEINRENLNWNDYEGIDVEGKWVLILKGDPENDRAESDFLLFSDDRDKVLLARDKGAVGVLLVSGQHFDPEDKLVPLYFDKTSSDAGLPIINIKREVASQLMKTKTIDQVEITIDSLMQPQSFELNMIVKSVTEIVQQRVRTQNVIAMIEGSDPMLKNEYIIIGAHYDHLGMGGPGSGSREPDVMTPHNGADDNASGVAGIIELGEKLAANKDQLKRSVILIAFDAEETGLLGSSFFTRESPVELGLIKTMFNFDMIGRLNNETSSFIINGTGTSVEAEDILNRHKENIELGVAFSREGYGPSDHAAFYSEDIPVFFFTTGTHSDYHTPADDVELLNLEGEKLILEYAYGVIMEVANRQEQLTYQIAGPKKQIRYGRQLKVTLGIMPDFTSTEENGLGVGAVTPDRPAEKAGLKKHDRIVAIDGKSIKNIYDYMIRLKKLEAGQTISVDVIREGKKLVLLVQL